MNRERNDRAPGGAARGLLALLVGMSLACAGLGSDPGEAEGPLLPVSGSGEVSRFYGYGDATGRMVVPADLQDAQRHREGLAWAKQGDRWGILGEDGRWVVRPSLDYDRVQPFSGGVAAVRRGKLWGLVDRQGVEVVPPQYRYIGPFSEGWMLASRTRGSCHYLSPTGETLGEFQGCGSFSEGRAEVSVDKGWTYVDTELKSFDATFDETSRYSEGFAVVRPSLTVSQEHGVVGVWQFIDRDGRVVGEIEQAWAIEPFSDGVALVVDGSGYWFAGPDGKAALKHSFRRARSFSEGLALVEVEEGKFAYLARSGELRIPGPFAYPGSWFGPHIGAVDFVDGVAFARPAGTTTWGLLDRDGGWVVAPRFDEVEPFSDGWARVTEGERVWWLGTDGSLREGG